MRTRHRKKTGRHPERHSHTPQEGHSHTLTDTLSHSETDTQIHTDKERDPESLKKLKKEIEN